jgi:hypothetical protein
MLKTRTELLVMRVLLSLVVAATLWYGSAEARPRGDAYTPRDPRLTTVESGEPDAGGTGKSSQSNDTGRPPQDDVASATDLIRWAGRLWMARILRAGL